MGEHLRILLSEAASKHLLEAGECFMIAGKSSHPEQPGRIVLHLVPIDKALADAACLVALGQARATRPRSTPRGVRFSRKGAAIERDKPAEFA